MLRAFLCENLNTDKRNKPVQNKSNQTSANVQAINCLFFLILCM